MQEEGDYRGNEQEGQSLRYSIPLSQPQLVLLRQLWENGLQLRQGEFGFAYRRLFQDCYPEDKELQTQLGWNKRRIEEVGRSLQGIFVIPDERVTKQTGFSTQRSFSALAFRQYCIPAENELAGRAALDTGKFEKTILPEDIVTLRAIWQLSSVLKEKRGEQGAHLPPPRFTAQQLAEEIRIDRKQVLESLQRLVGLLGESTQSFLQTTPNGTAKDGEMYGENVAYKRRSVFPLYIHRWFIPSAHRGIIQELLSAYA